MWPWKKKPEPQPNVAGNNSLTEFVRGIQHAVNSSMQMYEHHAAVFLGRHIEKDGTPKTTLIKIPGSNMVLIVPTITASHPPDMLLEEMEIRMQLRVSQIDQKEFDGEDPENKNRTAFTVSLAPKGDSSAVDLVMKFKRGDPPEGVSRIIDEFVRTIKPTPVLPVSDGAKPQ